MGKFDPDNNEALAGEPRLPYFTLEQVAQHTVPEDLWLAFLGRVVDLTALVQANPGPLAQPLIDAAGTEISHWFDPKTKDLRKHIDPESHLEQYYCPMKPFLHVPPPDPTDDWKNDFSLPWWQDNSYVVGLLTKKVRKVRVKNMLTCSEHTLKVCSEETVKEIEDHYLMHNAHADSYLWKRLGRKDEGEPAMVVLDMAKTLAANGVPDETPEFEKLSIDEDYYIPCLFIYFKDDLTVA